MTQLDILLKVCETLNKLGIEYMLIGAYAVSFYGRPRTTHDIDLNIVISPENIKKVYDEFQNSFYISQEDIEEAIRYHTMFNIIHNETMDKVDFWIIKDNEFDRQRLVRKRKEKIKDVTVFICSPEDVVLSKLNWYKKSNIQKHYEDVLGIFEVQIGKLDLDYLRKWAKRLSLLDILEEIIKKCS